MHYLETFRIVRALAVGLVAFGVTSAFASVQGQEPRRAAQREDRAAQRENVEGLMEAYVISKLQESLDLTDQQFAEMVVAQKRLSEHRRNYRQERTRTLQELRQLLGQSEVPDDEIAPMLTRLDDIQEAFNAQQRKDYETIDKILDVRRRAKYRLLEQEIQRRFQQMVRQIRQRRVPNQDRPKGGNPF